MDFAWFVYTIALMLVAMVASSVAFVSWVLTNRKSWLVSAAAFMCYLMEVAVVFFGEYVGDKPMLEAYFNSGLQWPAFTIPLCVAIVTLVWVWVAIRVHVKVEPRRIVLFACAYAVAATLVAPIGDLADAKRNMLYWGLRDCALISSLVFGWWHYRFRATQNERTDIQRASGFFKVIAALSILMLCEDSFFIMAYHPSDIKNPVLYSFFWHLTERNMTENVIMIVCAVRLVLYAREVIAVYARHPAEGSSDGMGESLEASVDAKLPLYCDAHGMSPREREVLSLLLQGCSIQMIANKLVISPGTVKAHLHRIYSKAGVSNRDELVRGFWSF